MGLAAQVSRLARLIVTIEPLETEAPPPAPPLATKPGLLAALFAIEPVGFEESAGPAASGSAPRGRGVVAELLAVEPLAKDEPEPAKPPAPYLKWLLWPETLEPDER